MNEDSGTAEGMNGTNGMDADSLRLFAYREIVTVPINAMLHCSNSSKEFQSKTISLLQSLLIASPDLVIRKLAVEAIQILSSANVET